MIERGIDECMGSWTHQVFRALRGRPVHVARFSLSRVVRDDCELNRVGGWGNRSVDGTGGWDSFVVIDRIAERDFYRAGGWMWAAIAASRVRFGSRDSSTDRRTLA